MSDTIIRKAEKTENFTIVDNEVPRRCDISARAKGIYFYLMTLPKNWEIHKEEIYTHFIEGRDALDTAWAELVNTGYIQKEIVREKGIITGTRWIANESSRITGKPSDGKPVTGKPKSDNPQLLSTDSLLSTDKQSTNNIPAKQERPKKERKSFTPPTQEEVIAYVLEKKLVTNPYTFFEYYEKLDWKDNQGNPVKSWKGKAVTWDSREKVRSPNAQPYSLPVSSSPKKKIQCPRCGAEVIAGLCTKCRTPVDSDGKELK